MTAIASIVIPAYDESALIGECLDTMLHGALPGELELVVVANGCTDDTAAVAKRRASVQVAEISRASKTEALNVGDQVAKTWPRIYVDADVRLDITAIRATVDVLTKGNAMAAAPWLQVDTSGRPWLVRAYFQIYLQLPWTRQAMVGSGVYALSRDGHERLVEFPDVINDDLLVSRLFHQSERVTADATFTVPAPHDVVTLIKTKTRAATGNLVLRRRPPQNVSLVVRKRAASHYLRLLARPSQWPALLAYVGIYGVTRIGAYLRYRRGDLHTWNRDRTTRDRTTRDRNEATALP